MISKKPLYQDAVTVVTHDDIAYSILGDIIEGVTIPKGCNIVSLYFSDSVSSDTKGIPFKV